MSVFGSVACEVVGGSEGEVAESGEEEGWRESEGLRVQNPETRCQMKRLERGRDD